MPLILHIDTALEHASISISRNGKLLSLAENTNQKDHAAWLHPGIQKLISDLEFTWKQIDAVAVSNGPGSYTGLRVGLSSAKGICFALTIPLITLSTLKIMSVAASANSMNGFAEKRFGIFCPMIDARRMEVFTALYDLELNEIQEPQAKLIDENSFEKELNAGKILFFGNGAAKCRQIIHHTNAIFETSRHNASHMIGLAEQKYVQKDFASLAYAEPYYIKGFHTTMPKK